MKKMFAVATAVLLYSISVEGAAITVQADDTNGFATSNGTDLGINNLVRVGTFNLTDNEIAVNQTNIPFLDANFVEFGALRIGAGYSPMVPGNFDVHIDRGTNSDSLGLQNRQVYLWVFASTTISPGTDAASVRAS